MISRPCYLSSSVSLFLFFLFIFSHASNSWSQTTGTELSSQTDVSELSKCHINTDAQPESALEVNVESVNSFLSTISAAREALACLTSDGEPVLVDVTIFAKLTDRIDTNSKVGRTVQALVCAKDVNGTNIHCASEPPREELIAICRYVQMDTATRGQQKFYSPLF
jgi:hypothetical protein